MISIAILAVAALKMSLPDPDPAPKISLPHPDLDRGICVSVLELLNFRNLLKQFNFFKFAEENQHFC